MHDHYEHKHYTLPEKLMNIIMYMYSVCYIIVMQANSAGASGDFNTARSQNNLSIGCTITGAVSTVVGIGVIIGIIYASAIGSAASS